MGSDEISVIMKKLEEVGDKVQAIHQGLYGLADTEERGLCGEFKALKTDYQKFKENVIKIFGILVGAGVLTGTGAGIVKILGG